MSAAAAAVRILLLLALGLTAVAWSAVQFGRHALQPVGEGEPPTAVQEFLANPTNPPVCYYEGVSERTERPSSARDWAYTLVLGDCHPQANSIPKLLIDALVPVRAGSLTTQASENPVQYTQSRPAAQAAPDLQERQ